MGASVQAWRGGRGGELSFAQRHKINEREKELYLESSRDDLSLDV